jgi:hypothetical protein
MDYNYNIFFNTIILQLFPRYIDWNWLTLVFMILGFYAFLGINSSKIRNQIGFFNLTKELEVIGDYGIAGKEVSLVN